MFFSKPISPLTQAVLVDPKTKLYWPTECSSEELYRSSVEIVKNHLRDWIDSDIFYVTSTNQTLEDTLSFQLCQLQLLRLPEPKIFDSFAHLLDPNALNNTAGRLIDACTSATMDIPTEVFYCIRGRFLFAVTEGLYSELDEEATYPTKVQWAELLIQFPWLPYIKYIQEIFETEKQFQEIRKRVVRDRAIQTTVAVNSSTAG